MIRLFFQFKGAVFLLVLFGLWEVVGQFNLVQTPQFFPPVSEILLTLWGLILNGELPGHLEGTVTRALGGLAISCAISIPLGIWMGYSRIARDLFTPTVEMLRPIPPAAIIPVAILFLGIHNEMKLAVIIFGCVWPILINTIAGVRAIDSVLIETGRTLNLHGVFFIWEIVVKGASPYIVSGVRISLAISLILAIVSEMIAGNDGLGYFIIISERSFQVKEMYAGIFAIAILGFAMNHVFMFIVNRYLMRWHQGYTAQL